MIWLLRDFDLFSVVLRAASLSLEALTLGGVLFLIAVALPSSRDEDLLAATRRSVQCCALALLGLQLVAVALEVAILMGTSGFPFRSLLTANFFLAGAAGMSGSLLLMVCLQSNLRRMSYLSTMPAVLVLGAALAQSHAASRLDHRALLLLLTALHHLGTAAWIGGQLSLLLALRRTRLQAVAETMARRYSAIAVVAVPVLVLAGIGMSWFYIGSWQGVYGTSYGAMVVAKVYLLLVMLLLGAGNYQLLRAGGAALSGGHRGVALPGAGFLLRLRRFSEAEIGLGLTAILAAASLTSQAPAIDLQTDQLSMHQIAIRMKWETPRLSSPSLAQLAPAGTLAAAMQAGQMGAVYTNDAMDRAWSEYNHHWAGLIVLCAGLLAFAAGALPRGSLRSLAGNWPLLFLGLALFILLRADPENWPLGPRPFWASFSQPDVLEHRVFALLISCFAFFEWSVETGRVHSRRAAYVFPLLCAAGGAALLTHSHASGNVQDEMLAELAHLPIAVLGATAGWGRWLQLRLPGTRAAGVAAVLWPLCLALSGLVLLDYRES